MWLPLHSKRISLSLLVSLLLVLATGCNSSSSPHITISSSTHGPLHCTTTSTTPVTLSMYYGSEKQPWLDKVKKRFNDAHVSACDGPITINSIPIGSGDSMQQILDGKLQPDIWAPAGSVWTTLINTKWQVLHGSNFVGSGANDAITLFSSPVVIAMWQNEAQALGWPQRQLGWADIAALSTNPQGWAAYGHPELGDFKFGHTHPDDSNSGLDAIIAENYAAVGKTRGLTLGDINQPATKEFVANVESSIIHYGDTTGFFGNEMFDKGPSFLSAAVIYENKVVEARDYTLHPNAKNYPPVVAIYPKEGTFLSDHPFIIPQATWITPAKRAAAQVFCNYLLDAPQQQAALQFGFRPSDLQHAPLGAPLDSAHGVDITQPTTLLQIPNADVIAQIKQNWNDQRRKVDVMLILDHSGSMQDPTQEGGPSKIDAAKQGMTDFVHLLGDTDSLGLTDFSDDTTVLSPVEPLGPKRQTVLSLIQGITPIGSTRLFDTIAGQADALAHMPSKHIKALVVLTDGMDNASQLSINDLLTKITPTGNNAGNSLKIYTIAYGSDADTTGLSQIATATGAQEYPGNTDNIRAIYLNISRFFAPSQP